MAQQSTYIQIDLDIGEAVSLFRTKNCVLRCSSGTIWLTEDDGNGDIVLTAGDVFQLTRNGRTVIQSVEKERGATCQLMPAQDFRQTLAALGHWASVLLGKPGLRRALSMHREQDTITSRT